MDLYEQRVLKLREHVLSHEKKREDKEIDYDNIKIAELRALLDEKGIEYDKKEKKAELWAKLEELVEETTNEDELELDELIVEEEDDEETGE